MIKNVLLFFKGFAMGLANVIPGVSGGTIALLTGIFERFINALKSFDLEALKLLSKFKFKEFAQHTDLLFLIILFLGEGISILTGAKLLEWLFKNYEVHVWAFFFGLILASVYYVGRMVNKINLWKVLLAIVGAAVAFGFSIISPATENDNIFYLVLCGAIAICDMLLPGISGSFTLILLGNYKLIVIDSISHLNLAVLIPVAIGAVIGFLAFSRFLSWLMKTYADQTLSVLTGFIFGSLVFIWPWKKPIYLMQNGHEVFNSHGDVIIQGYDKFIPEFNQQTFVAIAFIIAGMALVCVIEEISSRKAKTAEVELKKE
ncbi:MAG: DUF368 domain-containing protein [Bacteroidales bacterium]|nr:DUF368 domain-containing protein [Bacteroidales bacterium]